MADGRLHSAGPFLSRPQLPSGKQHAVSTKKEESLAPQNDLPWVAQRLKMCWEREGGKKIVKARRDRKTQNFWSTMNSEPNRSSKITQRLADENVMAWGQCNKRIAGQASQGKRKSRTESHSPGKLMGSVVDWRALQQAIRKQRKGRAISQKKLTQRRGKFLYKRPEEKIETRTYKKRAIWPT